MVRLETTPTPPEKHQQQQINSTNNDTTTSVTINAGAVDVSATNAGNLSATLSNDIEMAATIATESTLSTTTSPTTVIVNTPIISQSTATATTVKNQNGGINTVKGNNNNGNNNSHRINNTGNISVNTSEGSLTPSTPSPQLPTQIILSTAPIPTTLNHHQQQQQQQQQQQTNLTNPPGVIIPTPHPAHTIQVMTNPSQGLPPPPQPPCAIHQTPQQQQQQLAALQAHLAAIAHQQQQQQQHHHPHMAGPPQQQSGQQQQPPQQHSHMPPPLQHTHPSHQLHHHHHHHGPPPSMQGPQQQQQHLGQHATHLHENGHIGGGNGSIGINPNNVSSNSSGNGSGGSGSSPINGPNGPNQNGAAGAVPPPPGGIYIPYTGEFYPTEHGYFIPHPHDICPAHPTLCSIPSEFGPTTVQMVSQNRPPPIPVPVQVPQGQVMQQYVNDGTLTHVVLSPSQYQQLQQLHAGQGGVPHLHHQYITNGTTSHATYYSPIPTGFPGPGGGPHYHQIQSGHLQPQQMSHSPSPPNNYHNKDDRTQRQHAKLLRKLNNRDMNSAMSTPAHSPSPRKELNGRRISRNGASSVGTSEDGEESSSVPDDEDDCQTIIEQLSAIQKPEVTDITSRSAMLRWEAPPLSEAILNSRDLRYDVLLSDRGKEGKYKMIFKGESYVCMIQDLRPGQEYHCRLQVHYEKLHGNVSEPTAFTTPPCEPDQPLPPKLIARTKNSLQLRWQAPYENGSHITQYILETDDCKGKGFVETIRTKGKQYTLTKLQSSSLYNFRLSAVNECGPSIYSDVIAFSTSVNLPSIPKPPQLLASNSNYLRLAWEHRQNDETFCLQMNDHSSGHGYLTAYNGPETVYECTNLKRATVYHFKLRAENEAGTSPWSNEVAYKTQPERPGRPSKPQIKGKIHGNYFKAKWDPPNDRGGADIRRYYLEISSGAKFQQIYNGSEPETVCDRLSPGTTYQIRVCCEGPGGVSNYSDVCTVTTEAIQPGAPEPPYCDNMPGPFAAVLRWNPPDYNGGAPVLEYEIKLTGLPNYCDEIIYRGKDMYCVCKELRPGESYEANVRAVNRIGAGSWSEPLKFKSGAAPPNQPDAPEISVKSPTHLSLSWKEPSSNGAPIIEYRLESSLTNESGDNFSVSYQGLQTTTDIRNLIPYTLYYFRLNAANLAGQSLYSQTVSQKTPAAAPTAPEITKSEITATEVTLTWSEAESNGSHILYYQIEYVTVNSSTSCSTNSNNNLNSNSNNNNNNNNNLYNNNLSNINNNINNNNTYKNCGNSDNSTERLISTVKNCTEFTIENLLPETTYKFKIQAVNEIGTGQWSSSSKLTTLPPPPEPPKMECTGVGHNFIKLKWGEGRNIDFVNYYVEMYNYRLKDFQIVHSGTSLMCKINKLQEQTAYTFRICAETDRAGTGDYSEEYVFKTSATLPSSIKAPRIAADIIPNELRGGTPTSINNVLSAINTGNSVGVFHPLTIEWQHSKNSFVDPVEYILQCSTTGKENDYIEIHRGPDTRYTIDYLDPGSVYLFRVAPVRVTPNGDILGSFTYPLRYQVPHKLTQDQLDSIHHYHNLQQQSNLIHRTSVTTLGAAGPVGSSLNQIGSFNSNSLGQQSKTNNSSGLFSGILSSLSGNINTNTGNNSATLVHNDGVNSILHSNNMIIHGNTSGGTNSDIINNDEIFDFNVFGAIRRFLHKCYTLYTNPKQFSDTQQAIFWMFSFLLITFIFAYLLRMFMR